MNIECGQDVLEELNSTFRYNDAIIRSMVIRRKEAITAESPIMKLENAEKADKEARERRNVAKAKADAEAAAIAASAENPIAESDVVAEKVDVSEQSTEGQALEPETETETETKAEAEEG
jgi:small subunit ribosomal protein S6